MEVTLEKIELVRDRTGVSYKEAKDALEAADGSIVDAIIALEETTEGGETVRSAAEQVGSKKDAVMGKIKEIVNKGNVNKIIITKDDKTVLNIPLTAGLLGTIIAPWGVIAGALAAFGTKCKIEFLKEDGSTIDLSGRATEFVGNAKEKGNEVYQSVRERAPQSFDELKAKGQEVYQSVKEKAPGSIDELKAKGQEAFEKAKDVASDAADKAKSKIKRGVDEIEDLDFDDIKEELGEAIDEAVDTVEETVNEINE